jgi:hypothetical protein
VEVSLLPRPPRRLPPADKWSTGVPGGIRNLGGPSILPRRDTVRVAYTVKISVETDASSPSLALHEAGEKWNETKAKFEEIGDVEVVRVTPVIEPKTPGENGASRRRQPAATEA